MTAVLKVTPVPCAHIAEYYDVLWHAHKCLAWQLLRWGYRQWSVGVIVADNNLFGALQEEYDGNR